ncbi:MAG: serine/threonine protein kinase [Myxococcales bacterium]|nr:serine/threonine protein kinase [Myxococcales bacterium]
MALAEQPSPDSTLPARHGEWLAPGFVVASRYRIESVLGAGGFGHVYVATQIGLGRRVALKVLPASATASAEQLERFQREAALAQRLEHPNTVRLFDHGVSAEGIPFIALELLRGETLATSIARIGPQADERVARVAAQVLKALMEAHALGVVHRDIKPANIFLTSHAGEPLFVKLLDFGIAKQSQDAVPPSRQIAAASAQPSSTALTSASHVMGTPRYMAPEQVRGEPVGPPADLYALGLTLAEMIAGRPVFDTENALEIISTHLADQPVQLPEAALGSRLRAVLERATTSRPEARYADAREMLDAIEALGLRSPEAQPTLAKSTVAQAFAKTEATPVASRRGAARYRVSRRVWWVGGAALLAVAGAAATVALRSPERASAPSRSLSSLSRSSEPAAPPGTNGLTVVQLKGGASSADVVRDIAPPFPDRGFENHPRRYAALPALDPEIIRKRLEASGFIEVRTLDAQSVVLISGTKEACTTNIQWAVEATAEAARARADSYGEKVGWIHAAIASENRVLIVGGGAPTPVESRECVEGVLALLLNPAKGTP